MKTKNNWYLLMLPMLVLSLSACGSNSKQAESTSASTASASVEESTSAASASVGTDASTEAASVEEESSAAGSSIEAETDTDAGSASAETTGEDAEDDYPISDDSLDMDGYLLTINTEGLGQVARAEVGRTFKFNDEYPVQSTADHLADGTKLVIGAKADDGWKFEKWTLNGEDYSTEEQFDYTVTEDADFIAVFALEEASDEDAEDDDSAEDEASADASEPGAESSTLPAFVYHGDAKTAAICDYLTQDIASDYLEAEVSIPYMQIVDTDDSDPEDTLVWGVFLVMNYNLKGDILETVSGGSHPGLMHLQKKDDGSYVVTSLDAVADGSDFIPSAKRIFGDRYEAFSKAQSDNDALEAIRAEYIREYVESNGLNITAYQDYGWDPVPLAEGADADSAQESGEAR